MRVVAVIDGVVGEVVVAGVICKCRLGNIEIRGEEGFKFILVVGSGEVS